MSTSNPEWHVSMPGQQPVGPFTVSQVLGGLKTGRLNSEALCWREGMDHWLPLNQVEPFAAAIRGATVRAAPAAPTATPSPVPAPIPASVTTPPQRVSSGKAVRRVVVMTVLLALLAAVAYGSFVVLSEGRAVDKGRKLLADGEYAEARRALGAVADGGYLYRRDANYLFAVAASKEFAAEKDEQDEDDLRGPKRRFEEAFADESRREQAMTDMTDLVSLIPADADDVFPRSLALADFLAELKLADGKQLAIALLDKLKQVRERPGGAAVKAIDVKVVRRIIKEDGSRAKDVLAIVFAKAGSPASYMPAAMTVRQWAGSDESLRSPLALALLERAESAPASGDAAERYFALAEDIHPEVREQVVAKRLGVAKRQIDAKSFSAALASLDRLGPRREGAEAEVAPLYYSIAEGLATSDPAVAVRALDRALAIDANLAGNEKGEWLWIALHAQPTEERLRRCQEFLRRYPESLHSPKVLAIVLADGIQLAQQNPWQTEKAAGHLQIAQAAAAQLLEKHRDTEGLDRLLFALAQRHAAVKDWKAAIELANTVLIDFPRTVIADEINQASKRWEDSRRAKDREIVGALPDPLVKVAEEVERQFKSVTIDTPATIRDLANDPRMVHVAIVSENCTANLFSKDEKELLRAWVQGGGIAWVNNDVLSIFEVGYRGPTWAVGGVCKVALRSCPLAAGCDEVQVSSRVYDLAADRVLPLLAKDGHAYWSVVRYGKGYISNVPTVQRNTYDGARFWLNFRLFCMHQPIPDAPTQVIVFHEGGGKIIHGPTPPPPPDPTTVATADELDKALTDRAKQRVMWVQLTKAEITEEQLKQLTVWVEAGGVLWIDTDLGRSVGFQLTKSPGGKDRGRAVVADASHPIVKGIPAKTEVAFVLSSTPMGITGELRDLNREMTPLLGYIALATARTQRAWIFCAVRNQGRGKVVYRPREFAADAIGQQVERNLREWSFKVAPPEKPTPQGKEKADEAAEPST